jgi:serine/threonine protein kinase
MCVCVCGHAETQALSTFYGTPLYASPELCDNAEYTEKTDIWSLGVVVRASRPACVVVCVFVCCVNAGI